MRKIRGMKTGVRVGMAAMAFFFAVCSGIVVAAADEARGPERIILNLTESPATSQAVTWRTREKVEQPQAQIARAVASPNFEDGALNVDAKTEITYISKEQAVYSYSVVFESLEADTEYAYRVGGPDNWSEWNQFTTAAGGPKPFSFVYLGDPQNDVLSMCSRVFRAAFEKAPDADFWLFVGDIVNYGEEDSEWGEFYDALGWIPRVTPFILLPGNHGYHRSEDMPGGQGEAGVTRLWRPQFTLPENGPEGLEETSYFLDYQGVRFVMLNGNEKLEEQARWLKKVLKNNPQRWTVVSIHQPFYSTAGNRDNTYHQMLFVNTLEKYRVDLVLQGHDHTYGRTYKVLNGKKRDMDGPGIVYVVTVAGPKQYNSGKVYEHLMAKTGTQTQLFQVIRVDGDRLEYNSYTVAGELFDSFTLEK